MATSLAGLLAPQSVTGAALDLTAPLKAATTGYASPRTSAAAQAVTVPRPTVQAVQVPKLAQAAAAPKNVDLRGDYAKIGAKLRAKAQAPAPNSPPVMSAKPGTAAAGAAPSGIVGAARTMLGVPYVWGGNDPRKALDCSSFVQQAYAKVGVSIPRTTYAQFAAGTPVNLKNIQAGDAVYVEPQKQGPGHVGLYIGNGMIQESPHKGTVNQIIPLSAFLNDGFVGVRRF